MSRVVYHVLAIAFLSEDVVLCAKMVVLIISEVVTFNS